MEDDETASKLYETIHQNNTIDMLPELSKMAAIFAVIPTTSCSAEWAFSGPWRLKANLNSTVNQARLSNLALLNIEGPYANEVFKNIMTQMIDSCAKKNNRDRFFFLFFFGWQLNKSRNAGMFMRWVITSDFRIFTWLFAKCSDKVKGILLGCNFAAKPA